MSKVLSFGTNGCIMGCQFCQNDNITKVKKGGDYYEDTIHKEFMNIYEEYKKELNVLKNQNIDVTHFEDNINKFKEGFGRNYRLASERFSKAIIEIDNTIDHLNKIKENLLKTDDNLRLANNKVEDLTIKKLTYK